MGQFSIFEPQAGFEPAIFYPADRAGFLSFTHSSPFFINFIFENIFHRFKYEVLLTALEPVQKRMVFFHFLN